MHTVALLDRVPVTRKVVTAATLTAMFCTGFLLVPVVAGAQTEDETLATATGLTLSAVGVSLLISVIIPIVTGIVTKSGLSGTWKGIITLFLSAVTAVVTVGTLGDGSAFISWDALILALMNFAIAVATYLGIYKQGGLTNSVNGPAAPKLGPNFGIGPSTPAA